MNITLSLPTPISRLFFEVWKMRFSFNLSWSTLNSSRRGFTIGLPLPSRVLPLVALMVPVLASSCQFYRQPRAWAKFPVRENDEGSMWNTSGVPRINSEFDCASASHSYFKSHGAYSISESCIHFFFFQSDIFRECEHSSLNGNFQYHNSDEFSMYNFSLTKLTCFGNVLPKTTLAPLKRKEKKS